MVVLEEEEEKFLSRTRRDATSDVMVVRLGMLRPEIAQLETNTAKFLTISLLNIAGN